MLEKLTKKNERGFTLAELLVVVAIIAILVAVSIPIFTSKLEKSREATDVANMRAATAAATVAVLDETAVAGIFYYDAQEGVLVGSDTKPAGYGKGTTKDAETKFKGYDSEKAYTNQVIKVTITAATATTDAGITLVWE